jgi:hypothetical protein
MKNGLLKYSLLKWLQMLIETRSVITIRTNLASVAVPAVNGLDGSASRSSRFIQRK